MKLELNLKNQYAYTVEDVEASILALAGKLGQKGYHLDGTVFNTETPVTGMTLYNAHNGQRVELETNLDVNFDYPDSAIELITLDCVANGVKTCLKRLYYVRYGRLLTPSYDNAVSILKKEQRRRRSNRLWRELTQPKITSKNLELVRHLKGFKTVKAENVTVTITNYLDLNVKTYEVRNNDSGRNKQFKIYE